MSTQWIIPPKLPLPDKKVTHGITSISAFSSFASSRSVSLHTDMEGLLIPGKYYPLFAFLLKVCLTVDRARILQRGGINLSRVRFWRQK